MLMEQLLQTQASISDIFVRLVAEKAALDRTTQRYAEHDAQSRDLLSAVHDFAERQRRVEDDIRRLMKRQCESDRVLEKGIIQMFKEKREKDERIQEEIEEIFKEGVHGAQEMENHLRRFDIIVSSVDEDPAQSASDDGRHLASISSASLPPSSFLDGSSSFSNTLASPTLQRPESMVSLTPLDIPKRPSSSLSASPPSNIPEMKPEPQEWDFFDYEEGVVWGTAGAPQIKPPTSFTEFHEPEVVTPTKQLPLEPFDVDVAIPIPGWTVNSAQEIKITGVRILKDGGLQLSVKILDGQTDPGALEELTHDLTRYHHETIHELVGKPDTGDFVSVKSSHGKVWHRGQILRPAKKSRPAVHLVHFIDYGFHEIVGIKDIRPLPPLFRFLPQQSQTAGLSFVKFPNPDSQHHAAALKALQEACAGRKLVAKLEDNVSGLRLMHPGVDSNDILASINGKLVRDGLARIGGYRSNSAYKQPSTWNVLVKTAINARNKGLGMYQREGIV